MMCQIVLEGDSLSYELCRKRVKNINLRIRADGTVFVSANTWVTQTQIESFLRKKSEWILRAQARFRASAADTLPPPQYVSGEPFYLLGRKYTLRVCQGKHNSVAEEGNWLILAVTDPSRFALKKRVLEEYRDAVCSDTMKRLCMAVYPIFADYGIPFPTIRFRKMRARWGSCRPKEGVLTFNKRLGAYPISCMEYVVIHEFVHFLHPDHSVRFYERLGAWMPDWKERKALLDTFPARQDGTEVRRDEGKGEEK